MGVLLNLIYYKEMVIMIEELHSCRYVQVTLNLARRIHFTELFFQALLACDWLSCKMLAKSTDDGPAAVVGFSALEH